MKTLEKNLVTSNLGYVYSYVNDIINKWPELRSLREDLVLAGIEGLILASKKFNKDKNVKFLTYAYFYMKREINEEIRVNLQFLKISRGSLQREKKIQSLIKENKTNEEIAEILNIKENTVKAYNQKTKIVSLEEPLHESINEKPIKLKDTLSTDESVEEMVQKKIDKKKLRKILITAIKEELDESEIYILKNRFIKENPKSLRQLGKELKVSKETIRKKQERALRKLKKHLEKKGIKKEDFI